MRRAPADSKLGPMSEPIPYVETRLQLHWAAQVLAGVAHARLPARSDDGQSNLAYEAALGALVTRPLPDGSRLGLRLREPVAVLRIVDGTVTEEQLVEGARLPDLLAWADAPFGGEPAALRDYDMPDHGVARGEPFAVADSGPLAEVAAHAARAWGLLGRAVAPHAHTDVRLWPHHFDFGSLVLRAPGEDPATDPSVGVGFSLGDATFPEPYLYVNPYGVADPEARRPALPAGGAWADGWLGAVLHAGPPARSEAELEAFLTGAIDVCLAWIGYER